MAATVRACADMDVVISNFMAASQVFFNDGSGTFTEDVDNALIHFSRCSCPSAGGGVAREPSDARWHARTCVEASMAADPSFAACAVDAR